MKVLFHGVLVLSLVLLSLRPSLTNRTDSTASKGPWVITCSTDVHFHSSAKGLRYRGSFEKSEKKAFAPSNTLPDGWAVCFLAAPYKAAEPESTGALLRPSFSSVRILRI